MDHAQYQALIETLRGLVKKSSLKYQDIADSLGVSIPTIKRIFAGEDCNIGRIMAICELVQVRFFDLVELARSEHSPNCYLTEAQEAYFAEDPLSLGVFRLLHRGWDSEVVRAKFAIKKTEFSAMMKSLEDLGLVRREIGGKVRVTTSGNLRWHQQGPLAKKLLLKQNVSFMKTAYDDITNPAVCYMMGESFFTEDSLKEMVTEYQQLGRKYRARSWREEMLVPKDELKSVHSLIVIAPYETNWRETGFPSQD
jgi:hypothetical protein